MGFTQSGWLSGKESAQHAGNLDSIPGSGRSPRERNGNPLPGNSNPLHCSCLENLMDRGALWATFHGVSKSQAQLSD